MSNDATETIEVSREALRRLELVRKEGETLDRTILRVVQTYQWDELGRYLEENPVSDEFLEAVEEQVAQRGAPQNTRDHHGDAGHDDAGRPDPGTAV